MLVATKHRLFTLPHTGPLQIAKGGPIFIVLANRCGVEREACYAGTSSVISFRDGKGYIYDMLGKYDEQCMVVDLKQVRAKFLHSHDDFDNADECRHPSMRFRPCRTQRYRT